MKHLAILPFALFCLLATTKVQAQVDLKVNPIGILFNNINFAAEFGLSDNFGLEITPGYGWDRLGVLNSSDTENKYRGSLLRMGVNGRYYLNPSEKGLNGFYIGAFTRYKGGKYTLDTEEVKSNKVSLGFLLGTKVVARNEKLLFDFGIGFGRALVNKYSDSNSDEDVNLADVPFFSWDIPIYITVGYRISGGGK